MPRTLLAVIPIIASVLSCTPLRDRGSVLEGGSDSDTTLIEVTRPREGFVEQFGPRRLLPRVSEPLRDWYQAQFGLKGITPYLRPALLPDDKGERGDPEAEMFAWLHEPQVRTLVVVGQDDYGGEGLVARFVHRLTTATLEGRTTPIPILIEMCQLLGPKERGRPLSRGELAARALEQRLGTRPDPRAIQADLEALSIRRGGRSRSRPG